MFAGRTLRGITERAARAPLLEADVPTGSAPALSAPQRRLWFLDQLAPDSTAYNVALPERLRGPLDVPALQAALTEVARRHDVLRWRLTESDGLPDVVVDPPGPVPLTVIDLTEPPTARPHCGPRSTPRRPPGSTSPPGPCGARSSSVSTPTTTSWPSPSTTRCSTAGPRRRSTPTWPRPTPQRGALTPLSTTFADYVTWRADRDQRRAEADLDWWTTKLGDAPLVVDLPRDRARPPVQTYTGRTAHATVDSATSEAVTRLATTLATPPSTVLLAAFGELLRRLTGRRDLVIGTPAADRRHLAFHDLVGFFVEIMPLRLRPDPVTDFADQVRACRDVVLDALAHPATPLDKIVDALATQRDPSRAPLVQVLFNVYNFPEPRLRLPGVTTEAIRPSMPGSPFDLTVYVVRREDRFAVDVLYNPDLFDAARIEALLAAYTELVGALTAAPDRAVGLARDAAAGRRDPRYAGARADHRADGGPVESHGDRDRRCVA